VQERDEHALQHRQPEQERAAACERIFLAQPHDDGKVQRQQQPDGVDDRPTAEVDESAIGEREDDDAENEPAAARDDPEQRSAPEHDQWCGVDEEREGIG
jgi:hypothetical protein